MIEFLASIAKALVAFVAPGAVVLTSAVQEVSAGGEAITSGEWVTAVCATIITGAAVYAVPNRAPASTPTPSPFASQDGRHEL